MTPLHILFALAVVAIWGGNFIAIKYTLEHFPPFFATALRFALCASLLVWFVPFIRRDQLKAVAIISVLSTLHFSLPYVGMDMGLNIASIAIVAQMGVPFACLLGALMLNDRLGKWRISGLVIAFTGMAVVLGSPNILSHPLAFALSLAGAFFWGLSNVMMKLRHMENDNVLQMLAWLSVFMTPQLFLIASILEPGAWQTLQNIPTRPIMGMAYTVLLSTVVAHGLWFFLIRHYPVTQIAPYSLLVPVLGIILAQLFFKEPITWYIIAGGVITIIGVGIIVARRPRIVAPWKGHMNIIECPSANCDNRGGHPVDMLVLHYTGMRNADDARDKLCNAAASKRVSAHYLVDEDGAIYRLVPEEKRAWHAGVSYWRGETNINQRSIGIEIVNPGHEYGYRPFPEAQMQAVAELCREILACQRIPARNIVGHSDVAPARKQDPGELFNWEWLAERGIGLWPRRVEVPVGKKDFDADEVLGCLQYYGYDVTDPYRAIIAFQRHFRPKLLNGIWDAECDALLKSLLDEVE